MHLRLHAYCFLSAVITVFIHWNSLFIGNVSQWFTGVCVNLDKK